MNLLCKDKNYCSRNIAALFTYSSSTVHVFKIIKNEFHDIIYTFKIYFIIIFLISTNISSIQMNICVKRTPNSIKPGSPREERILDVTPFDLLLLARYCCVGRYFPSLLQ